MPPGTTPRPPRPGNPGIPDRPRPALRQPARTAPARASRETAGPRSPGIRCPRALHSLGSSTLERLYGPVCVKIYRAGARHRAEREWTALTFLARNQVTTAPVPLWADPGPEQPAIGMSSLPGRPFPWAGTGGEPLRAVAAVYRQYAALPLTAELGDLERAGPVSGCVRRITCTWAPALSDSPRDALARELLGMIDRWAGSGDAELLAAPAPRIFSRGSSEPGNWLWDGNRVRVTGFGGAGCSDLAFDLADLAEHPSSYEISGPAWDEAARLAGLGDEDFPRFAAARRTCALQRLAVLWPQRDAHAGEFGRQLDRIRCLQSTLAIA